jgi:hypothetical protein
MSIGHKEQYMFTTIIPTSIIPTHMPFMPQRRDPAKGEELDEFINRIDEGDDDELEDYEQTETTINQPKHKFPDDDSNVGDDPIYPDDDETNLDIDYPDKGIDDLDDDETTISVGI